MSTLNGLLAELGLSTPEMHPEREAPHETEWIVDQPFVPEPGQCYEIAYGKVSFQGRDIHVRKRIRADGSTPSQWFDLDAGQPLDPELQTHPVRAFRPLATGSVPPASH
jgi:hypothetical protein